jgi:RHS repeat-associated protein
MTSRLSGLGSLADLTPDFVDDAIDKGTKFVTETVPEAAEWTADLQEFRVLLRKDAAGGNDPTYDIELWETGGGAPLATLVSGATVSSDTGIVVSATWDASLLGTADGSAVELVIVGNRSGGNPSKRRTVEVGAVEWNVDHQGAPGSELYFLRARYYDPETGRFLGRDPLPFVNRYTYVGNNPVLLTDPSGLCGITDPLDCAGDLVECRLNSFDCIDPRQAVDPLIGLLPEGTAFNIFGSNISYQLLGTCLQYPEACAAAVAAMTVAQTATRALYGSPPWGEGERDVQTGDILVHKEGDAFQHCYWSGLITLQVGAGRAEAVTTRFEAWGSDNPARQRAYDLYNNKRGRELAQYLRAGPSAAGAATLLNYCRG